MMSTTPQTLQSAAVEPVSDSESLQGWRALPPALVLGLGLALIATVMNVLEARRAMMGDTTSPVLALGLGVATGVLELYGVVVLMQRHVGAPRIGLSVVTVALSVSLMMSLMWPVLVLRQPISHAALSALPIGWSSASMLYAIGLATALWRVSRAGAITVVLGLVAVQLIPMAVSSLWPDGSSDFLPVLRTAIAIGTVIRVAMIAWSMTRLSGVAPPPAPASIATGLRHAGYALRLVGLLMMGTLLLTIGPVGTDSTAASQVAGLVYTVDLWLGAGCIAWLGLSLARAGRTPGGEPAPYLLVMAAALLLVGGGGMLYAAVDQTMSWLRIGTASPATFQLTAPTVIRATLGGTVLAAAIARFAGRAGFEALRRRAIGIAVGIGVLFVPAFLASERLLASASPRTAFGGEVVVLIAGLLLASLCKAAAHAVEHTTQGLPVARVVELR